MHRLLATLAAIGFAITMLVSGEADASDVTMVTFQLFAIPAIDVLSGTNSRALPLLEATAAEPVHEKSGLTHFLPARLDWEGGRPRVKALRWQGSGDIATLSLSNCFVVVPFDRQDIAVGEIVSVLPRWDVL